MATVVKRVERTAFRASRTLDFAVLSAAITFPS